MTRLDQQLTVEQTGRTVSLSVPCPDVTLLQFLSLAEGESRFYWENDRDEVAFAGVGTAIELIAWGADRFEKIQQQATQLFDELTMLSDTDERTFPRLFGGFSFNNDFTPDNTWSIYAPAYFILPHYQLVNIYGDMWLTINAQIPHEEDPQQLLEDLRNALASKVTELQQAKPTATSDQSKLHDISYPMTQQLWTEMITRSVERIKRGDLKKVVLSRVCEVQLESRINLLSVLAYLAEHYANCYRFLFEPRPFHAFYGATPELLAGVQGDQLTTMGLAGSIRRGQTEAEDAELAEQLLNSAKDRHEHDLVVQRMRERLEPITSELKFEELAIYQLSNIQHLHTPIIGKLRDIDGVLPVIEKLHPTPALGGDPREIALKLISESEPVPRGWYAAPVGWIDCNLDGQFGVSIRSAVAQDKRVWAYAGAGIVADSEPQKEWEETALKFRPMLNALGISEQVVS